MESRPYPQWWTTRARERRASLDAVVQRLSEQLSRVDSVTLAIAFGSYARGSVGPSSDLDVIVVQESELEQGLRTAKMYELLQCPVPLDLVVYTPEEFERLKVIRSFVAQAVTEGKTIFARASA